MSPGLFSDSAQCFFSCQRSSIWTIGGHGVIGVGQSSNPTRGRYKTQDEGIESIRLLLAAGADINAVAHTITVNGAVIDPQTHAVLGGFEGWTALHGAAKKGWTKVVAFLAKNGAELQVADASGKTPLDYAEGKYKPSFLDAPPEPFEDTVALLKKLISEKVAEKL